MADLDESIVQRYAQHLLAKAGSVVRNWTIGGVVFGATLGAIPAFLQHNFIAHGAAGKFAVVLGALAAEVVAPEPVPIAPVPLAPVPDEPAAPPLIAVAPVPPVAVPEPEPDAAPAVPTPPVSVAPTAGPRLVGTTPELPPVSLDSAG